MNNFEPISGFSKLSKDQKINLLIEKFFNGDSHILESLKGFWHSDLKAQRVFDEFSENTITNFYFPFGVAPNFLINNKSYCVPMVIEESSVVAACSKSAKFWMTRGGFKSEVVSTDKVGQVHFIWNGESKKLFNLFNKSKNKILTNLSYLTANMEKRGGGVKDLVLVDKTDLESGYYQILGTFETCDAMGANFINSVLEEIARSFQEICANEESFIGTEKEVQIIMAILSNYTPDCRVKAWVECPVDALESNDLGMSAKEFAYKFDKAVKIAQLDVGRATTHNKGIFNGIDAVVLATGNDFRAVEACGHTYAASKGHYQSLTSVKLSDKIFKFEIDLPIALGTVGGLTSLHPLANFSLEMLGRPSAKELMSICACVGLAQNFAAVKSLVTTGIQRGHMKMHLMNILNHLDATNEERELSKNYFEDKIISFQSVRDYLKTVRNYQ